jgi:hypothetical protein
MTNEFFDQYIRWEFERSGVKRIMPYFYYDAAFSTATFTAASSRIKPLLPHPDMNPIEFLPGRGLVAFTAFEYRKTDGPPYNEVSISFLITFRKRQIPGLTATRMFQARAISAYVWQLPVTTEQARAGGVDLFGYPKFIADIDFAEDDNWRTCTLAKDGQTILTLRGRQLPTQPEKPTQFITYAVENGAPLVADVLVNPSEFAKSYRGTDVSLQIGPDHPIGRTLLDLKLGKQALIYQYCPVMEAILFPARNII